MPCVINAAESFDQLSPWALRHYEVHLETMFLKPTRDPTPNGRRLDRDRGQLPLPAHSPLIERHPRRLEAALAQLARLRIEHNHLEHRLVISIPAYNIFPGPPFVDEVTSRT